MYMNLKQISELIPGSKIHNCEKPETVQFDKVKNLSDADKSSLSFISSKNHTKEALDSKAICILTTEELSSKFTIPLLLVENVEIEIGKILDVFFPKPIPKGIVGQYVAIHSTSRIAERTDIGNFVSIGENSSIGKNTILEDGVRIGKNVTIGENARIGMNTVIYDDTIIGKNFIVFGNCTFGGDGFKFVTLNEIHHKIPQVGRVIIGDDVEIGSNCTIDRGGVEDTTIGNGCKIDNMVHIAHNCKIGNNVIIAGQSGVAGSCIIEDDVIIGGGCCISDHLFLPKGTIVAGGTGLRNSPKDSGIYVGWDWGFTFAEYQKVRVNIKQLIHLHKHLARIKNIEKKLGIENEGSIS
jgi:UDP-3-O-[3-hydroxymyristoyl] glucosamine N-acyltransferase